VPASRALARLAAALTFAYTLRGSFHGVPLTALELALVVLVLVYVVEKLRAHERFPGPAGTPYFWPVALLLAAATVALLLSPERRAAAGVWKAYFVEPALAAYVVADVLRSRADLARLVQGFFISGLVVSILNILAFGAAIAAHRPNLVEAPVVVLFNTPNATGLFLGPLVAAAAALVVFGERTERLVSLTFLVVAAPALAFSFSRGAWLGLAAALVLLAILHRRRLQAFAALGAAALGAMLVPAVRSRLAHEFNPDDPYNSVNTRTSVWRATIRMMSQGARPLTGTGLNGFHAAITPFKAVSGYREDLLYPHNTFLTFWTETGLLGLAAFAWILVAATRHATRAIRAHTPLHAYHVAFAAAAVAILVHGQLDVPYFKNDLSWMTMGLLGMHAAALRIDRRLA
jgi:O-antigen ligase